MDTLHITWLLTEGFEVVRILENHFVSERDATIDNPRYSWWVVTSFQPAQNNGIESTNFHTIKGYEISDWVNKHKLIMDKKAFINSMEQELQRLGVMNMTMDLSENHQFKRYHVAVEGYQAKN